MSLKRDRGRVRLHMGCGERLTGRLRAAAGTGSTRDRRPAQPPQPGGAGRDWR